MARALADINKQLVDAYVSNMAAAGVIVNTSTWSAVSVERLILFSCAFGIFIVEQLFDLLYAAIELLLLNKNPPTINWYIDKCLNFQFGFYTLYDTDQFDNTGHTAQEIEDSKVIKYAAVQKQINQYGRVILRIKVAGYNGTDLTQLSNDVVDALFTYFNNDGVAPAGDHFTCESLPPDSLQLSAIIKFNPLVLNAQGERLDGKAMTPVQDALKKFLVTNMKYGGDYRPTFHRDYVMEVEGVEDILITNVMANYGVLPYTVVFDKYTPDGGYLRFLQPTDLILTFEPI